MVLICSTIAINSFAQSFKISGAIYGIDGAISGAQVHVIDTKISTISDSNGAYTIEIPEGKTHLHYQYKKMEVNKNVIPQQQQENIILVPNEKKLYKIITKREQLRLCDIYLDYYPNGKNIEEVKVLKQKYFFIEAYNIAASQFSDTALRNYLKLYPNGSFKQKAIDAIEIASWQKARYNNTVDAYELYLKAYPNGKASQIAKDKLAELK